MSNRTNPSNAQPATESAATDPPAIRDRPATWFVAIVLAVVIVLVYGRGLNAPFMFDDDDSVVVNTSIRSLWPLVGTEEQRGPFNPIRDLPTSARPVVNYSFALNYHFGGLSVRGYHIVNVVLHFLSALLLFAIVRRTLRLPYFAGSFDSAAGWLAFAVALLWSLHPLNTEAVEYTTQRTELMMALFYLATIYCSLRYWSAIPLPPREGQGEGSPFLSQNRHRAIWLALAILACLGGMLSKEVMVSAPLVILLFERTFISGSFANALRRSWPLYLGLAATWIPLIALSFGAPRSFSSGFHLLTNPFVWWFTQCKVLLMYLKLAVWPWPLCCAYELERVDDPVEFILFVVPVLVLAILAIALVMRNHPVGFLLVFIAAILAPTSLMPIMTEMAAERRMYLPLAEIMVLLVIGAYLFGKRQWTLSIAAGESSSASKTPYVAAFVSLAAFAGLYCVMSAHRVSAYYDEMLMWQQVAESQKLNHIAHTKLGLLYNHAGREAESLAELQTAVRVNPGYPNGLSALGFALMNAGRLPEAIDKIKAALDIKPDHVGALNNMGIALTRMGQYPQAIEYLQRALTIDPTHADAHNNLGQALLKAGQPEEAAEHFQKAKSLTPDDPDVLDNLAGALVNNNQLPQAIELLERAIELRPDFAAAHNHLGICLHRSGDVAKAMQHFQRFLELRPDDPSASFNLATAAAEQKDFQKAASYYETVVRLQPDSADAHHGLATALLQSGKANDAIDHFQLALQLNQQYIPGYAGLAEALAAANRTDEAIQTAARGIEMANSQGDEANAKKLKEWLDSQAK